MPGNAGNRAELERLRTLAMQLGVDAALPRLAELLRGAEGGAAGVTVAGRSRSSSMSSSSRLDSGGGRGAVGAGAPKGAVRACVGWGAPKGVVIARGGAAGVATGLGSG